MLYNICTFLHAFYSIMTHPIAFYSIMRDYPRRRNFHRLTAIRPHLWTTARRSLCRRQVPAIASEDAKTRTIHCWTWTRHRIDIPNGTGTFKPIFKEHACHRCARNFNWHLVIIMILATTLVCLTTRAQILDQKIETFFNNSFRTNLVLRHCVWFGNPFGAFEKLHYFSDRLTFSPMW